MTEPHVEPPLTANQVVARLADSMDRLSLRFTLNSVGLLLNFIAVIVLIFGVVRLQTIATTNRATLVAVQNTLAIVQGVTSDESRETSNANLGALVANLYGEISCDARRQQARLAAAPPGQCRANTPPSVYPGIDGQPPRG